MSGPMACHMGMVCALVLCLPSPHWVWLAPHIGKVIRHNAYFWVHMTVIPALTTSPSRPSTWKLDCPAPYSGVPMGGGGRAPQRAPAHPAPALGSLIGPTQYISGVPKRASYQTIYLPHSLHMSEPMGLRHMGILCAPVLRLPSPQ